MSSNTVSYAEPSYNQREPQYELTDIRDDLDRFKQTYQQAEPPLRRIQDKRSMYPYDEWSRYPRIHHIIGRGLE